MKFIKTHDSKRTNSGLRHLYLGQRVINFPLYRVWNGIRQRCYNPNVKCYNRYGGRGIKVCKKWRESFICFYKWALDNGYKKGTSIDRVNNDGNYCPSNCRIATPIQQARNTRKSKYVIWEGKKVLLITLCEKLGVVYHIVNSRLKKGWDLKKALFTPNLKGKNHLYKKRAVRTIQERGVKTDLIYNGRMGQKYPIYLNWKGTYMIEKITPNGKKYPYNITRFKHLFSKTKQREGVNP